MDPATILADVQLGLSCFKMAIAIGQSLEQALPFIEAAWQVIVSHQPLSADQRAAMLAQEDVLRAQINAVTIPADE